MQVIYFTTAVFPLTIFPHQRNIKLIKYILLQNCSPMTAGNACEQYARPRPQPVLPDEKTRLFLNSRVNMTKKVTRYSVGAALAQQHP